MKEKNVDAIIIIGTSADLITFVRQMKENKFGVKYFHGYKGTWEGEFSKALGKDAEYVLADGLDSGRRVFLTRKRRGWESVTLTSSGNDR